MIEKSTVKPQTESYWNVIRKTTYDFANVSAISGLNNAAHSSGLIRKLIWIVIFVAGSILTTYDVINVFSSYFSYPFATQVNVIHSASIEFPEITICNHNRVSCKKLLIISMKYHEINYKRFNKYYKMYILAKCGSEGLGCDKVRDVYYAFTKSGKTVPPEALEQDQCLDCDELWTSFVGACGDRTKSDAYNEDYISKLNGFWIKQDCGHVDNYTTDTLEYKNCNNSTVQQNQNRRKRDVYSITSTNEDDDGPYSSSEETDFHSRPYYGIRYFENFDENSSMRLETATFKASKVFRRSPSHRFLERGQTRLSYLVSDPSGSSLDSINIGSIPEISENAYQNDTNEMSAGEAGNNSRKETASENYNLQMEFLALFMSLNSDERKEIGYKMEELILDCNFMEYKCDMRKDFKSVYSALYGNCYTYIQDSGKKTSLTSSIYGLSLVLDVDQDSYLPRLLTPKAGARLSIQRSFTRPPLEDNAIDLDVGKASSVAIQKIDLERLPTPFEANCAENWNQTHFGVSPDEDYYTVYTINDCLRMCLQRLFVESCACAHPLYPEDFVYGNLRYKGYNLCNLTEGHEDYLCVNKALDGFAVDTEDSSCECHVECQEVAYSLSLTSATWPPIVSKNTVSKNFNRTTIERNLLKVDVYFSSLNVDEVKQQAVYETTSDFVGSLGGAIGLYLGISVIVMGEVVEYLIILFWNLGLNCCGYFKIEDDQRKK